MEKEQPPTQQLRTVQEQNKLDEDLYQLFMIEDWADQATYIMEEGYRLIQAGATLLGPVHIMLGTQEKTLLDVAINVLIQRNNILPLLLLLENGIDSNGINQSGQTPYFTTATSYTPTDISNYNEVMMSTQHMLDWPRGPIRQRYSRWQTVHLSFKEDTIKQWLLDWLVEEGSHIDAKNRLGQTPLALLAQKLVSTVTAPLLLWQTFFHLIRSNASIEQPIIKMAINTVYANPIIQKLLGEGEREALKALATYIEEGAIDELLMQDLFITASGRGHQSIVSYLLQINSLSPKLDIPTAFVYAAQAGHLAIIKLLLPNLLLNRSAHQTLNRAFLASAAQNRDSIVQFLLWAEQAEKETISERKESVQEHEETTEEGEETERPKKKRKLAHRETEAHEIMTSIDQSTLFYALIRAARQGYTLVVDILLHHIYKTIAIEQNEAWLR